MIHFSQPLHITVMASRLLAFTLKQAVRPSKVSPRLALNIKQALSPSVQCIPATSNRAAPFHSSSPRAILPAGPRIFPKTSTSWFGADRGRQQRLFKELVCHPYCGSSSEVKLYISSSSEVKLYIANDPAPVPAPSPTHGSYHWTFER